MNITGPGTVHIEENSPAGTLYSTVFGAEILPRRSRDGLNARILQKRLFTLCYRLEISPFFAIGTQVATFTVGSGGSTSWSLSGASSGDFAIDEAGRLSVLNPPDREVWICSVMPLHDLRALPITVPFSYNRQDQHTL